MKEKILAVLLGILLTSVPVFAQTDPITQMIQVLQGYGFTLILLFLLTLAVTWGILSHVRIPQSIPTRGVISIVLAFLVLFGAAAAQAATFLTNLVVVGVVIAFGLMFLLIFLEISGAKVGEKHVFGAHPRFFATIIIILAVLIFIGLGGLGIIPITIPIISTPVMAILFFLAIIVVAVWVMFKESMEKKP